jgi:hypothetical protein
VRAAGNGEIVVTCPLQLSGNRMRPCLGHSGHTPKSESWLEYDAD